MRVQFYGRLGEQVGREIQLDPPHELERVADLRKHLCQLFSFAAEDLRSPRVRACVADVMVDEECRLQPDDVVAFFPPLSGG